MASFGCSISPKEVFRVLSFFSLRRLAANDLILSRDLRGDIYLGVVGLVRTRLFMTSFRLGVGSGPQKTPYIATDSIP